MPNDVDWLAACRRIVEQQRAVFDEYDSIAERTAYDGIGEGGDHALVIDRKTEDLVFEELERQAAAGLSMRAVSEERGQVTLGEDDAETTVVIDPIDGSLNARRTLPSHCLSIAVAGGNSMADVHFGYVYEFGAGEEFVAERSSGATLNGRPLRTHDPGERLEVVGLESTDPAVLTGPVDELAGKTWRIRAVGAIAISLCYVAAGRFDGMLTAKVCRSVDCAAAQLIVREAGGAVEFERTPLPEASLELSARYRVIAGAGEASLGALAAAQARAPAP